MSINKYQQPTETRPDTSVRCSCGCLRIQERINAIPDGPPAPFIHLATADRCGSHTCGRVYGIKMEAHNAFNITARMVQSLYAKQKRGAYYMEELRTGKLKATGENNPIVEKTTRSMFPAAAPKAVDYSPNAFIEPEPRGQSDEVPF